MNSETTVEILTEQQNTLLFVDDEPNILAALRRLFRPLGYRIFIAESGAQGLEIFDSETIDLVISDMRMPVTSGMQILKALRRAGRDVPFILLSAFGDEATRAEAEALGAVFVAKPFDLNVLRAAVHRLFAD